MNFKLFFLFVFLFPIAAISQTINGTIVDEKGEAIPYATIFVKESMEGTVTNIHGKFNLNLQQGEYHIIARSLGYHQFEDKLMVTEENQEIKITLQTFHYQLSEVKVFSGNEDPAYYIIRNAINKAPIHQQEVTKYEANLYLKSNFVFTNIPRLMEKRITVNDKKLGDVLKEDKTYVIESIDKISYQYPNQYKQENISKKSSLTGFDEPPVMGLFTASFYEERPQNVISPLSSLALNHYKYRYEGYKQVGDFDVFKIKVIPKRRSDELAKGYIYIVDKVWSIYSVDFDMSVKFAKFRLKQQYEMVSDNIWLPVSTTIKGKLSLLGLKAQYFYGSSIKYLNITPNSHSVYVEKDTLKSHLNRPKTNAKIEYLKKKIEKISSKKNLKNRDVKKIARLNRKILKEQYKEGIITESKGNNYKIISKKDTIPRSEQYWDSIRTIPLTPEELSSYAMSDSIKAISKNASVDSVKIKNKKNLFVDILKGKTWRNSDSTITTKYNGLLTPTNSNYNAVDGISYFQGIDFVFKIDSAKNIRLDNKIGYAFHRKAWLWSVKSSFRNILLKENTLDLSVGKNSFDFKNNGISNAVNSISTFFFAKNYKKFYESTYFKALAKQKINKNFQFFVGARYDKFTQLHNNTTYVFSKNKHFEINIPHSQKLYFSNIRNQKSFLYLLGLSYHKRQRKPWLQSSNYLMIYDFFNVRVKFIHGVKNVFDSNSDFSLLDLNFYQQANLTPISGIAWKLNAGVFLHNNQMHFSQFKHFQTAESPVSFKNFQYTFQLINDYELSNNKYYVNVGAEYKTEFLALRYFSFLNKNSWSESIYLNHLYSDVYNYTEVGYSLNNIFLLGKVGVFAGFNNLKYKSLGIKLSISVQ